MCGFVCQEVVGNIRVWMLVWGREWGSSTGLLSLERDDLWSGSIGISGTDLFSIEVLQNMEGYEGRSGQRTGARGKEGPLRSNSSV